MFAFFSTFFILHDFLSLKLMKPVDYKIQIASNQID